MGQKKLLLFDVDGTICDSGKQITDSMALKINRLVLNDYLIGIVGGGTYEKIKWQLNNKILPNYIFSECGSVYHKLFKDIEANSHQYILLNKNNLRLEPEYICINKLVKTCLKFISETDYLVSGNFIDLRNGLIYVSLVGMVSNDEERQNFIKLDIKFGIRNELIEILKTQAKELGIYEYLDICNGGHVGIAIYPKKWNKVQVLDLLEIDIKLNKEQPFAQIHYFGDKYLPDGNDYLIMEQPDVISHRIDTLEQTLIELEELTYDTN